MQFWKHYVDQLKEVADSLLSLGEFQVVPDWKYIGPTSPLVDIPTALYPMILPLILNLQYRSDARYKSNAFIAGNECV